MKHILQVFFFCGLLWNGVHAQITVEASTFPAVGDTLRTAIDNLPSGIDLGANGANQLWDFTSLQAPFSAEQIILAASEGVQADTFPDADIVTDFGNGAEAYYRITAETYEFLGYAGEDPAGLGVDLVARFEPPTAERRAPMNFLDINTTSGDLSIPFAGDDLPEAILENLPITPDSLRLRITSSRTDVVDAWGTLMIPGGSFEVLREKRIENRDTRIDVRIGGFPWQDITDLLQFGDFLGADTVVTYNYYSNEVKEPIAIVTLDASEENIQTVAYKALDIISSTPAIQRGKQDVTAFPNPAIDSARFQFSNLSRGTYKLKIYNILGVVVWEDNYRISGDKTVQVDLSDLRKGTYLYSIQNEQGTTLATKRLLIIRP